MSETTKAAAPEDEESAHEPAEAGPPAPTESKPLVTAELLRTLRWAVPLTWLVGVFAAGYVAGIEVAFLVLAAGVLVLIITLTWSSVQSLTGAATLDFEEALGMGAPSRVEEEKRAVLRALKDLEYERGVGKITPEDYAELSAKYRAEAKRLIQSVDATLEPARVEIEKELKARLEQAGVELPAEPPAAEAAQAPEERAEAAVEAATEPASARAKPAEENP